MPLQMVGAESVANWSRFVPVGQGDADWESYQSFKGKTSDSLGRRLRSLSLAQLVRRVAGEGVPGRFAECGCFRGHSTHIIASAMTRAGVSDRGLLVFDSFEGLSAPTPEDFNVAPDHVDALGQQKRLRAGEQMFASPLEYTKANLKEHDFIDYRVGWIPDTFAGLENETFAFAHVDVDLYAPVKASLDFIYPRMSAGGIIQIDDYNFVDWPGAQQAVDEFLPTAKPSFFFELPLGGAFLVK